MKNLQKVFDDMETVNGLDSIEEQSVYEETGVDCSRIESGVFERLGLQKKKRHTGKRMIITLIAAVIGTALIGTTAFAALGGLAPAFGELFSGDLNSANLYSGSNISVNTSNENLNVNVLGVTGDENTAFVAVELTHKDGSAITEANSKVELYKTYYINQYDFDDCKDEYADYQSYLEEFQIDTEKNIFDWFPHSSDEYGGAFFSCVGGWEDILNTDVTQTSMVKFTVSDDGKKIHMYVKIKSNNTTPKGRKINISCRSLLESTPVRILETFDNYDNDIQTAADLKYLRQNINGRFIYNGKNYDYWQTENKKLDLQFDLSLRLNYKTNTKTVSVGKDIADDLFFMDEHDNAQITLSSFGMNINAPTDNTAIPLYNGKNGRVIMKDGTEYIPIVTNGITDKNTDTITLEYRPYDANLDYDKLNDLIDPTYDLELLNSEPVLIDIDDIDKIVISGHEITVA